MLSDFESFLAGAYFLCALGLAFPGLWRFWTLAEFWRAPARERRRAAREKNAAPPPAAEGADWPFVTVQLPLYNERYVAERAMKAAAALDYPPGRLEIQVLDDSTDDTRAIVGRAADRLRESGSNIQVVRRQNRGGYKAGALANGTRAARGELIAIFDADFIPAPGWLRGMVGAFRDPRVGMAQAPWSFLNAEASSLARAQADFLRGHFLVEQRGRSAAGRFFNFNGTAGVWRREAIESAGGWSADTLVEDLDLSYRAWMAGWRFAYVPENAAPSELPVDWAAYKKQQRRWTKGGVQAAGKLLPRLLFGRGLGLADRLDALARPLCLLSYPLLLGLALLMPPLLALRSRYGLDHLAWADLAALCLGTLPVGLFFFASGRAAGASRLGALGRIPSLMAFGISLALNNSRAVLEGLAGLETPFERTAKRGSAEGRGRFEAFAYASETDFQALLEIALAAYFAAAFAGGLWLAPWQSWPFLGLLAWGFGLAAVRSAGQILDSWRSPAPVDDPALPGASASGASPA